MKKSSVLYKTLTGPEESYLTNDHNKFAKTGDKNTNITQNYRLRHANDFQPICFTDGINN